MDDPREFVFGYGSLSSGSTVSAVATLADTVRVWDVAMDNAAAIPGYKYYVDPVTGARPAVCVTFLDISDAPGVGCVGVLVAVGSGEPALAALAALDVRERNYDRIDVTGLVSCETPGVLEGARVWVYRASTVARERYRAAAGAGVAVVQRAYLESVEAEFAARGLAERYAASTRPPECPVADLVRVDVPA